MLPMRSISKQLCLLLAVILVSGQEHESDYSVDEVDDHSDFTDDSGHPDYSKYYSVDSSAPLVTPTANNANSGSGFVGPTDFYSFFGSPEFGASNSKQAVVPPKDPFKSETKSVGFANLKEEFPEFYNSGPYQKDFFEDSQKKQQQEEGSEENSSPAYISHHLPARYISPESEETREESEVNEEEEEAPTHEKNLKNDFEEIEKDKLEDKEAEDDGKYKEQDYDYNVPKYTNYNTGKSSSTVSQYPRAEGLYDNNNKYTQTPLPKLTPYQKYSFQPVSSNYDFQIENLEALITPAPAPYNPTYSKLKTDPQTFLPQATENVPSHLQDKKCVKIKKYIEEKDHESGKLTNEPMDCFVCEDPKTKTKYTQCSYRSAPQGENKYSGTSQRYSVPAKGSDGFRYKRYSGDDYTDPYEYVRSKSLASYEDSGEDKPKKSKKSDDFVYEPDFSYDTEPDKSYSEIQSEELQKNPGNCEKIKKDGMTCTICKNAKTGGNFEQCSYTSEPNEKKYAYVTEKKFDSLDQPEEGSESKSVPQTKEAETKKQSKNDKPKESIPEFGRRKAKKNYEPLEDYEGRNQKAKRPQREFDNRNTRRNEETREHVRQPVSEHENHRSFQQRSDAKKAPKNTKQFIDHDHFEYTAPQKIVENTKKPKESKEVPAHDDPHFHFHDEFHLPDFKPSRKLVDDNPYNIPKHFAESTAQDEPKPASSGTVSSQLSGEVSPKSEKTKQVEKDIDEYYFKFFPEFANEESNPSEAQVEYPSEESKKDVEDVLAEFVKKDRSECKKAERNGMTCYLCVDKKGIQHEECMYVSESKPKATHVAYHEVKHIKPEDKPETAESKKIEDKQPSQASQPEVTETKRKRFFKKASPLSLDSSASEEVVTRVKFNPNKLKYRKTKKGYNDPKAAASAYDSEKITDDPDEPTQKTPVEFVVGDEEGAYSAETRPVYSKALGVKLPKYMIEKSEFEKEFDEFASEH